ncbi:3-keto-disaccharide hydrolase [Dysgonomonas gadei]|uniref:3-keto-alpha-glucoside-1,2-lyase/3-keto-2-hydroxy-glucal hydratase domain-containing protein n=1 Tax=Dysgonomonas gadei ATCC BAA-286 TaxID=742766 RepID=F5J1V8_9BACT|nr:DUF1080 domain-containing protein [Dysgonomonas gadei]EGK00372.1 hypothetical protein HMPREF9455_03325 [Dysgonomonas gadei ATCC BAA-286]
MNNLTSSKILILGLTALLFWACGNKPSNNEDGWETLLDKNMSEWESYLSYEMKNSYNGSIPKNANGDTIQPIGYNTSYKDVFTVVSDENNDPVLRISGEVYGCVFTKESYRNYHLRLKMRWGEMKWEPRLNKAYDSGILYHSQGEPGIDYWRSWMLSHEFQLIESSPEGNNGDYWCIGKTQMDVHVRNDSGKMVFDPQAPLTTMGAGIPDGYYCAVNKPNGKPRGEWNDIDLICFEGKSLHIVNGEVVMALSNLRYTDENNITHPLDEGKIQLQSEAGEVFFKDIKIRKITEIPSQYCKYFK